MEPCLGDLLFIGFDGVELDVDLRAFLLEIRPGGVILFKRNIKDPHQTFRLIEELKSLYDPPPLLAVDEEGGRVSRLDGIAPTLPPAARLALLRDEAGVRDLAASLGRMLRSLGFDIDFAPVSDLCGADAPNGIGDRSFGVDPESACRLIGAFLDGLAVGGVTGCLKHFPGLGPTSCDSHLDLPTVRKDETRFRAEDLLPYRRLRDRAPIVMVGHGHYPFLAGDEPIAATLTPAIATGLLRHEIGFAGLALADDLEMKAVAARLSYDELAPRAVAAGCDMLLVCRDRDAIMRSHRALAEWAEQGRLDEARLRESFSRVTALRTLLGARGGAPSGPGAFAEARDDLGSRLERFAG